MTYEAANEQPWMARRNCTQSEAELFFIEPPRKARSSWDWDSEAKALCAVCPVRTECLTYAIDNDEQWGVWGGLNEREREALVTGGAA